MTAGYQETRFTQRTCRSEGRHTRSATGRNSPFAVGREADTGLVLFSEQVPRARIDPLRTLRLLAVGLLRHGERRISLASPPSESKARKGTMETIAISDGDDFYCLISSAISEADRLYRLRLLLKKTDDEWPDDFDPNDIPILYTAIRDILMAWSERRGEVSLEVGKAVSILRSGVERQLADPSRDVNGDERLERILTALDRRI
jgi:hypothetical protein